MKYQDLIDKLTLEQKAGFLSGKTFWETFDLPELGVPSIFLADGPHGIRKQAGESDHLGLNESLKATCFPTASAMANSWNIALGELVGVALGREARKQRVNVLLGPGLNIKRNPLCGRNFEYFSEDPLLAGLMASSYIRGIQSSGIAACPKHFAANNQEYRRMVSDSIIDQRALREIYLTGFELAVKAGAKTIMTAYNRLNGEYANENTHLLCDILRGEWGYQGVIVTDWGGNNDRVKALQATNELEMPTNGGDTNRDIVRAVRSGALAEQEVDSALDRLFSLIFDTTLALSAPESELDVDSHHQIALNAAEECIVLLKNQGVLPLDTSRKVALIGDFASVPRYQGAGSSVVNPTKVDSTLDALAEYGINSVGFQRGFARYGKPSKKLIKQAVSLAQTADVILLYVGLDEMSETEGLDRPTMRLPQNQLQLIEALRTLGKPIVAVLSCGSVVETDWADGVDALVYASLAGQAGARAILNTLCGRVCPSGKLAESFPVRYADCPSSSIFPGKPLTAEYRESIFVGYRYYDTAGVSVSYPFGFGLSYTTFDYTDLAITDQAVSFTLTNSGTFDGAEVAQLYIGRKNSAVFRPAKELKGFEKVFLKAGESATITIPFDEISFRYFNTLTNRFEVEGGEYDIMIGASSADIRLKGRLTIDGTTTQMPYDPLELPSYFGGDVGRVSREEFARLYGDLPKNQQDFVKRKRIIVDHNTSIDDLRYARGWSGRFFAWGLRRAHGLLLLLGKRKTANIMMMGVCNMPLRGLSRMSGGAISWGQLEGLLKMFNGKFFGGLKIFLSEGKKQKKRKKAEKKEKKEKMKQK